MTVTATPVLPQTPRNTKIQITAATTLVTAYTGGANGSKIVGVILSSTDTSAQSVQIGITRGTFYILGTFTIPITAGTVAGTNPVNLLDPGIITGLPKDNDGQAYIFLSDASDTLQVQALALNGGKVMNVTAIGADF